MSYDCPAEGCDYSADEVASVKSHIHAKSGPEHEDKGALKRVLEEESTDEQGGEQGESAPGQGDDEQGESTPEGGAQGGAERGASGSSDSESTEQGSEQGEAAENSGSNHPGEGAESGAMPTDDEYDRLKSGSTTEQTAPSEGTSDGSGGGLPGLQVDPWTAGLLVGLVLLLGLAYLWLRSGDSSAATDTTTRPPTEEDDGGTGGGGDVTLVEGS